MGTCLEKVVNSTGTGKAFPKMVNIRGHKFLSRFIGNSFSICIPSIPIDIVCIGG